MYKIFTIAAVFFLFSSCTTLKYSQINVDLTKVNIGMSENQVQDAIGKPANVISAYQDDKGDWKVYEYLRDEFNAYLNKSTLRPYWLYFLNGKLDKWAPGEDWQGDQALLKSRMDRLQQKSVKQEEKDIK